MEVLLNEVGREGRKAVLIPSQELRRAPCGVGERGVYLPQNGHDFVTDKVAAIVVAEVGAVLDVLNAVFGEVLLYLRTAHAQQRTDDVLPPRGNAAQAERTAAAGEVEDKRLGVIVGIMRRGDKPAAALFRGALQKLIAQPPCRILGPKSVHQSIARHVPVTDDAFYPTLRAPVFHKARVSQRFLAADAVFIVRSDNVRAA